MSAARLRPPMARFARSAARFCTLAACLLLAACEHDVELLGSVTEAEANDVVAALDDAHVPAHKQPGKDGVVSVLVDASQIAKAVSTLQAAGLPRESHVQMGEVFRKEGLISSPLEERARYLWALSQELGETVTQIDGVLKARVHVVLPERAEGGAAAVVSSASVFVKHRPGVDLRPLVPKIQHLIANSVPGLVDERVVVVLVAAQSDAPPLAESVRASAAATARASDAMPAAIVTVDASAGRRHAAWLGLSVLLALALASGLAYAFRHKLGLGRGPAVPPGARERE